jgi:aspartate racemase
MNNSKHFGIIGGLGVGAAVLYYQGITAACAARGIVPRLTMAHAHAPNALALVQAGRIDDLAAYLAGFVSELSAAGAECFAIPAITPHICLAQLRRLTSLPIIDILEIIAQRLRERQLSRVALFGTKFTIEGRLFGALDGVDVVKPTSDEIDAIHGVYLELATHGRTSADGEARLRDVAHALIRRERVEAIVLAGTDLNLIFSEANAGFPAVDCTAAPVDAIVERMTA